LIAAILGDAGIHARAAVGVASLPLDAAVEIEALFAIS
jgi:enamine deaminase RidA (YjgF/YER057c/UK114 family)